MATMDFELIYNSRNYMSLIDYTIMVVTGKIYDSRNLLSLIDSIPAKVIMKYRIYNTLSH